MSRSYSIVIASTDSYLAGIYARKFEFDNWNVDVAESETEVMEKTVKMRPDIILLDDDICDDIVDLIKKLRSMPTLTACKIVVVVKIGEVEKVKSAREAGAVDYLIMGHFVPHEAVEKMKNLLEA